MSNIIDFADKTKKNPLNDNNHLLKNLNDKLIEAERDNDQEKKEVIQKIFKEIEKLLIVKEIQKNNKLNSFFKNDINLVMQDGSFHLIEMILQKEIELLELGDYKAIEMLNKIKKNAQDKIQKLDIIFAQNQQKKESQNNSPTVRIIVEKPSSYKPMIAYEGFHFEKTLGGEFIEVLDPDIKILVGTDIVNSRPQDLSTKIIDDIKNIKRGNDVSEDSVVLLKKPESIKDKKNIKENSQEFVLGKWTNDVVKNVNNEAILELKK